MQKEKQHKMEKKRKKREIKKKTSLASLYTHKKTTTEEKS